MRLTEAEFQKLRQSSVYCYSKGKAQEKPKNTLKQLYSPSKLESAMEQQLKALKIPPPTKELRFHPVRGWRFDFAWETQKVALEVEGGTYQHGKYKNGVKQKSRHLTPTGYNGDCRKYNAAAAQGWLVVKADSKMVNNGEALDDLVAVLRYRGLEVS
ncbi:hypothetical protein [Endozoicomonas lisbonensis]|uniref:Very-short-patch-repair endonuclease n=1 Tax=Endozoicomonas lisbonensis TaxID=3120522 RepID=A0ABV2SP33_9GAMM